MGFLVLWRIAIAEFALAQLGESERYRKTSEYARNCVSYSCTALDAGTNKGS